MFCRTMKVVLLALIISIVCIPISAVFGSTVAVIALILGLLYILDED